MTKYIIKRVGMMLATLLAITVLAFTIMHAVPGGPFTSDRELPPAVEQQLNEKYHLDLPLPAQYFDDIQGLLLEQDFGPSFKYQGMSVNTLIEKGFPVSARLGLVTIVFVLLAAIPLGIVAALTNGRWQDAHQLDGRYAAFGYMREGFEVLDAIAQTPTLPPEQENRPLVDQVIASICVEEQTE